MRTERTCSLSSTQRIVFLGRMQSRFCRTPPCGGSRPMGQSGASAGLQAHRSGVFKNMPRGPAGCGLRRVVGRLLRERQTRESEALLSAPRGNSATYPASEGCRTMGCERGRCASAGCHAAPANAGDRSAADTVRINAGKTGPISLRLQTAMVRWGVATAGQSSFSQLKLSVIQAKAIHLQRRLQLHAKSSSTLSNSTKGYRAWQRRKLAKSANIRACTSTACCEGRMDHWGLHGDAC